MHMTGRVMKEKNIGRIVVIGMLLLISACASLQEPLSAERAENTIRMTATNFKFQPNNIMTRVGDTITFAIKNTSGTTHNFSLMDPTGNTIRNIDIPAGESVDVTVTFSKAGIYPFQCNKTGHSTLGMKGRVTASAP